MAAHQKEDIHSSLEYCEDPNTDSDSVGAKDDKRKNKPKMTKTLMLVDKRILELLLKYGHAKIHHISKLLPRSINAVRLRCRMLLAYGYLDSIKDEREIVYKLSPNGYQILTRKSPQAADSKIRGLELINMDLARADWAIEQGGFIAISGFEHISQITEGGMDLTMLDGIAEDEQGNRRFLIVDSDDVSDHIAGTVSKINGFFEQFRDKPSSLDVVTFHSHRKEKIERNTDCFNLTVIPAEFLYISARPPRGLDRPLMSGCLAHIADAEI